MLRAMRNRGVEEEGVRASQQNSLDAAMNDQFRAAAGGDGATARAWMHAGHAAVGFRRRGRVGTTPRSG